MKTQHFFFFSFFHLTSDLFLSFYFHFQSLAFQRSSALKKKQLGRTKEAGLIPLITLSSWPPRHLPLAKVSNFPKPSYSKITQVTPWRARETGVKKAQPLHKHPHVSSLLSLRSENLHSSCF